MQKCSFFGRFLIGAAALGLTVAGCDKKSSDAEPAPAFPASGQAITPPAPATPDSLETPAPAPQAAKDPAMVLAVVNGTEITQGELDKEIATMMNRMQGRVPPERLGQMRAQMQQQMLENLVNRQVLFDRIASENITISDEEFDAAVKELTATLPPGATLDAMLAQTGTTMDEFRENFGTELKIRKLIEGHSGGKIEVPEEDALAFYNENKEQFEKPESVSASHILISVEEGASDEDKAAKRAELEAIRAKIVEGADFAEMAGEHSSCPSKAQGGSLGEFTRGRMVPEFEQAAFSQEIGAVGDIVETQFGYHLIKVTGRSDAGATPFDEVKEQLTRYLSGQKQQQATRDLVEKWVGEAAISYPGQP